MLSRILPLSLVVVFGCVGSAAGQPAAPARLAAPTADPVIAAAGDIACDPGDENFNGGAGTAQFCRQRHTATLLSGVDAVLPLGDTQYFEGAASAYTLSYGPSWGQYKSISRPAPGNHEYASGSAGGYFTFFGALAGDPLKGYYSYDLGTWHLIALNSECTFIGGCNVGSLQEIWLQADLAATSKECILAYWHKPRYSSGLHQSDPTYIPFWNVLDAAGADVVLSGHDHDYERFAPQNSNAQADPNGIRQFVVGTGGNGLRPFGDTAPNTEIRTSTAFGVLKLTLHATSYDWLFVRESGFEDPAVPFSDSGTAICGPPTAVGVSSFSAARTGAATRLIWHTASESRALGFNLFRSQQGKRVRLNRVLIPARGRARGARYGWLDRSAVRGQARYTLELVGVDGRARRVGSLVVPR